MKGNGPMALAFERGEFTLMYDNSLSYLNNRKHFRESGIANELFTFGAPDENGDWKDKKGNWYRDPTWPKVPSYMEWYEKATGKKFSDVGAEGTGTLALLRINVGANKAFLLQPGTPEDVLTAWRTAVSNAFKDPAFVKQKNRIIGEYSPTVGAAARKSLKETFTMTDGEKAFIKKYLKSHYNLDANI
jgi:hypothetical protein